MSGVPARVERWLRRGEVVLWCDRPRPRVLGWPPRSPRGLLAWAILGSAVGVGALAGSVAWSRATGLAPAAESLAVLLSVAAVAGLPLLVTIAGLEWLQWRPPVHYAVVRGAAGGLVGYVVGDGLARRFAITRPPETARGVELGEVDWGLLQIEVLGSGPPHLMRTKTAREVWTDVAYPHVVVELTSSAAPDPTAGKGSA